VWEEREGNREQRAASRLTGAHGAEGHRLAPDLAGRGSTRLAALGASSIASNLESSLIGPTDGSSNVVVRRAASKLPRYIWARNREPDGKSGASARRRERAEVNSEKSKSRSQLDGDDALRGSQVGERKKKVPIGVVLQARWMGWGANGEALRAVDTTGRAQK